MGFDKEMDINVKLQRFQQACGAVIKTLADNVKKETLQRFCNTKLSVWTSVLNTYRKTKGELGAAELCCVRRATDRLQIQ
jgi:hypothetical protein